MFIKDLYLTFFTDIQYFFTAVIKDQMLKLFTFINFPTGASLNLGLICNTINANFDPILDLIQCSGLP